MFVFLSISFPPPVFLPFPFSSTFPPLPSLFCFLSLLFYLLLLNFFPFHVLLPLLLLLIFSPLLILLLLLLLLIFFFSPFTASPTFTPYHLSSP
jgi:hypothetical protein